MTIVALPSRDAAELVRDQQQGLTAWHRDLERRLARDPATEVDREAQMDARRLIAGLQRTRSAVKAWQAHRARAKGCPGQGPRAVVVHRNDWTRTTLCQALTELGVTVVGEGDDGAVAVAMAVVDQPDLLVLEDRLPWVAPNEVVAQVHEYAPHTFVAVQMEDSAEADAMLEAGATAVFSRGVRPVELAESCVSALSLQVAERSA